MDLGAFSISLAVKDLQASRTFYEKLGFEVTAGGDEQHYLILKNGRASSVYSRECSRRTSSHSIRG